MAGGWQHAELLALDLETTGVDRRHDVPVSYALLVVAGGAVQRRHVGLVDPGREIPAEATAIHGITTERARAEGQPLGEAVTLLAEAVLRASARSVPVVGMNLAFDLSILDHQLRRLLGEGLAERGWHGPVLDVLVLDRHCDRYRRGRRRLEHLCAHYEVALHRGHEAGCDAEAAVGVLLALCRRFPALLERDPAELTAHQASWHREWARSYNAWRSRSGLSPLVPDDFSWPLLGQETAVA